MSSHLQMELGIPLSQLKPPLVLFRSSRPSSVKSVPFRPRAPNVEPSRVF
ncbi:hypothetical protein PHLGIDRAFT_115295 [Phlebiopsis gigantea 11061_1 CR5-6]|uniref:Uncharacterized protein n=1 Tax=Phlebiopsis gigantea (strain 11061_1 CR5-6) TaxID=745531 RepID=A0A0C3SC22_PHLG1|nr:hypothetical protein PHLGIDRAFT_115295 [Phlebiopsis gigantea 11061_1 CR5-6]